MYHALAINQIKWVGFDIVYSSEHLSYLKKHAFQSGDSDTEGRLTILKL